MGITLLVLYLLALTFILMYSMVQVHLAALYLRFQKRQKTAHELLPSVAPDAVWPMVTVQLPVYNEMYVIERLIDAVALFDYPADRLEVQVLDDSTDETTAIIAERVKHWQGQGAQISERVSGLLKAAAAAPAPVAA